MYVNLLKMAHHHHHQQQSQHNFQFMLDALYCEEEHWGGVETEEKEEEERLNNGGINHKPPLMFLEQDFSWEDEELSTLLAKQQENELYNGIKNNPSLAQARNEAIEWMLKVVSHYSFFASTALLAVNYLDRFVLSFQSHTEKPWMTQLAALACLSLAAKVEETQVPLLLDLQVEESKYVFEAKTIQRMELSVLSTLQWKMNPVTPTSFLDYTIRRLGLKNHLSWEFLKSCEGLLLAIISDCRFMCYLPSVLATATMLHVINNIEPCTLLEFQDQLIGMLGINKEKVEDCCRLVKEVASTLHFYPFNKRKYYASLPGSPKGVMDVSFSSDSSNDSWAVAGPSVSSSPEPLAKKSRPHQEPASGG